LFEPFLIAEYLIRNSGAHTKVELETFLLDLELHDIVNLSQGTSQIEHILKDLKFSIFEAVDIEKVFNHVVQMY
jgi:hypothetical protein